MKIINKIKLFTTTLILFMGMGACFADFSFDDMSLKFVQITDTHISDREDTPYKALSHSKELLSDAIAQVNALKGIDFVMFTGDMVDAPYKQSYKDFFTILTKLNRPSLMALGNHDTFSGPVEGERQVLGREEVLAIIKKCNPFYKYNKTYYAFSPKADYRVIVLDTVIDDKVTANGTLPEEQMEFLKNELNANQDKVVVIFQHHPVVEPFKSEYHKLLNADEYMKVIQQYKKTPIIILSGHYHTAKIIQQGNIIHVSSPSLISFPNAFREIDITNFSDRTIVSFKYFETNLTDVQKASKISAMAAATMQGIMNDRTAEITIRKSIENNNNLKVEKPRKINEPKVKAEKPKKEPKQRVKKVDEDVKQVQESLQNSIDEMTETVQ